MERFYFVTLDFTCPNTDCSGQVSDLLTVPDLSLRAAPAEGQQAVQCPFCDRHYQVIYSLQMEASTAAVEGDDSVHVEVHVAPEPLTFDFGTIEPPWDPHQVFLSARADLSVIVGQFDQADMLQDFDFKDWVVPSHYRAFSRMVLMQHFAIMEAYLADTLIVQVEKDEQVAETLIAKSTDLNSAKIPLLAAWRNPNAAREHVRLALREVNYHNFMKVAALYKIALDVDILPTGDDKDILLRAAQTRHDCVHRNGVSASGEVHEGLRALNLTVERIFGEMAQRIEDRIIEIVSARDTPPGHDW